MSRGATLHYSILLTVTNDKWVSYFGYLFQRHCISCFTACPDGWIEFNNSCYFFSKVDARYSVARVGRFSR